MKIHFPLLPALALAAVLLQDSPAPAQAAAAPAENGKVILEPTLKVGGIYVMEKFTQTKMAGGKQDHTTTEDFMIHVLPYGEGGEEKLARSRVDRVRVETNATADGSRISYDTADRSKQHPDLAAMAEGLKSITTGAIYGADDSFKAFEGAPDSESTRELMQALTDQGLPDGPVGPGDSWKHTIETQMGQMGTVKYELDYSFTRMVRHGGALCALLSIKGSMATVPSAGTAEGFDLKSRSLRGVMYFDPKLGAIRKYEINAQLDLTAHGKKMPGSMTTRTVLTRFIPAPPAPPATPATP